MTRVSKFIDIVFDGPPDHNAPRFIEVEDDQGKSINAGTWMQRDNGYWALRVTQGGVFDAGERMHRSLGLLPCTCKRQFPYSGEGTQMCHRCQSMAAWELATTGSSPTQQAFSLKKL